MDGAAASDKFGNGIDVVSAGRVGNFDWVLAQADTEAAFTDWLDTHGCGMFCGTGLGWRWQGARRYESTELGKGLAAGAVEHLSVHHHRAEANGWDAINFQ